MTLTGQDAPETGDEGPTLREQLAGRVADARARARAAVATRARACGSWLAALPRRAWDGILDLDTLLVWFLWNLDRSVPGRTAEALGALDRGAWRRLLALAFSPGWDRPLVALYRFRPPTLATVAAIAWVVLLAWGWGVTGTTATLSTPALGFVGLVVGSREYAKTDRGRLRGELGADGWASYWQLQKAMGRYAVRREAVRVRPSLEEATRGAWTDRPAARFVDRLPVTETGTWLGCTAVGPMFGVDLYASHRFVVGAVAPPQTAKTAWLGGAVIDHCGAALVTSTKTDLYEYTAALRALVAESGDVELFNPEGLGDIESTFYWSPLFGCTHPYVAAERAGAMVGATSAASGEDGQFWLDSAAKVLRCFLLAAAVAGLTMHDVAGWIASDDLAEAAGTILDDPRHRRRVPALWALELEQVLDTEAKRTKESIMLTLAQSVSFMADPAVAAICTPAADEPVFDVASFIRDKGTLYLVGSERPHQSIAPLLAALTSHVFEEAKRVAARSNKKGRLDPPLLLALDEVALITPIPLDRWTSDAGGRGIHIVWTCQSPSQLAQRWGERGRQTIWNNTNVKLIFGGLTLTDDLDDISRLCGPVTIPGTGGEYPDKTEQLARTDEVRELPEWHGVCIHRNTRPTVVRILPVWERRDVRHAPDYTPTPARERLRRRGAHLVPAQQPQEAAA